MRESVPDFEWPNPNFLANRAKFPVQELLKYVGQEVAWSWDGTRILASAATPEELKRKLTEAGVDPQHVVIGYVEHPDVSYL